jgi:hypothetical protein
MHEIVCTKKEIPVSKQEVNDHEFTIAQFGLKYCVLRMTSATYLTGINMKLSTSPSDILFNKLLQRVIIAWHH